MFTNKTATRSIAVAKSATDSIPNEIRNALLGLGFSDDVAVQAEADLNDKGQWAKRYLVASTQRVVVLSELGPAAGIATNGKNAPGYTVDWDLPISQLSQIETRTFVGSAAIEARLSLPEDGEPPMDGAAVPDRQRVIELVRSSNAYSRELSNAARQMQRFREGKEVEELNEDDVKWQRQACPKCGRALPNDSAVCTFCVNKWQALRRLLRYLGPYKWLAIGNGVMSISGVALSFVPAVAFSYLVDHVLKVTPGSNSSIPLADGSAYRALAWTILAIVTGSLLGALTNIIRGRWASLLGAWVLHDVRAETVEQLQRLSLAYYDKREVGAVMSRVQNDVGMLQNFLLDAAENIIIATLTILGVVLVMFSRSWTLAIVVLLPAPLVIVGTSTYWRGLMKLWRRVWHQNSALGARLADSLNGVRVVRAFAQEEAEVTRFHKKSAELRDATMRVERKAAVFYPALGFVMGLGGPLTWYVGGRQVLEGTLTFGGLALFTVLLTRLYEPIQQLTRLINFTTRAMTAAERVFEILDTEPEIRERANAISMPLVRGDIQFRDVTFGYDKFRPILHHVNLNVKAGSMIGLVGHSGAGKSTLINLLMRFYDVDEGSIFIDGFDLRDINRSDLRRQIGVVLQEPYLFHGSIWSNIAYGNPDATPMEIMAAAKAAFAHDFVVGFPDGYDTVVGERGTRLSGGERQRISIARAILHNPRILILDEATASVDTQTEQQIQLALANLIEGRTTFAIAHRLSTLRHADRLVVLEHGRIAEEGTHDELMLRRGVFHKLVTAQRWANDVFAVGG